MVLTPIKPYLAGIVTAADPVAERTGPSERPGAALGSGPVHQPIARHLDGCLATAANDPPAHLRPVIKGFNAGT